MNTISIKYTLFWQLIYHPQYQFTRCKKCFNVSRGKQIKMVLNGGIGFWIAGGFYPISKINNCLEKIIKEKLPF